MKCYCKQIDDGFFFVVDDAPEYCHDLITKAYFRKDGTSFVKWYPPDMPDKELVSRNYERLIPTVFLRETPHWEKALKQFITTAKENSVDFIIRGSVVPCMYGATIVPTAVCIEAHLKRHNRFICRRSWFLAFWNPFDS